MEKYQKWLYAGFVLSVLLNIFFIGLSLGKGSDFIGGAKKRPPYMHEFSMRRLQGHLSPEQREEVREKLGQERKNLRGIYGELLKVQQESKAILSAPDFDRDAFEKTMHRRSDIMKDMQDPVREIFVDVLSGLDAETRSKIAEDLFKHRKRGGRHSRHDKKPEGAPKPPAPDL